MPTETAGQLRIYSQAQPGVPTTRFPRRAKRRATEGCQRFALVARQKFYDVRRETGVERKNIRFRGDKPQARLPSIATRGGCPLEVVAKPKEPDLPALSPEYNIHHFCRNVSLLRIPGDAGFQTPYSC
jgi:hypothetical protein